jgi:dihydrolipoamide dehydrogenase
MSELFDLVVIGAGPGGYVAGIRAAQKGLKTAVIEKEALGGECLNHGCIPSKALIHVAEAFASTAELKSMGITVEKPTIDWPASIAWKNRIVRRLTTGVGTLLKAAGATVFSGQASFVGPQTIRIVDAGGEQEIKTRYTILATGSKTIAIPGLPLDGQVVISSREALALAEIPPRLIVVGGGYIGMELGTVFAMLGSQVTVVELLDNLLTGQPREAVKVVERNLRRLKIKALLRTKATGLELDGGVGKLTVVGPDGVARILEAEKILVTVGRKPFVGEVGLENTGVTRDKRGFVEVDAQRRTKDPAIFAIGDIVPGPMLAHKASAEALVAVAAIAGEEAAFSPEWYLPRRKSRRSASTRKPPMRKDWRSRKPCFRTRRLARH